MCVVSMVMDDWQKRNPIPEGWKIRPNDQWVDIPSDDVSRDEFEKLKKELESLRKLLKAAKIYDEETGQPDCEMQDKVDMIRKLAEYLGVDMQDVFGDA